jgi:hypothetical protein
MESRALRAHGIGVVAYRAVILNARLTNFALGDFFDGLFVHAIVPKGLVFFTHRSHAVCPFGQAAQSVIPIRCARERFAKNLLENGRRPLASLRRHAIGKVLHLRVTHTRFHIQQPAGSIALEIHLPDCLVVLILEQNFCWLAFCGVGGGHKGSSRGAEDHIGLFHAVAERDGSSITFS